MILASRYEPGDAEGDVSSMILDAEVVEGERDLDLLAGGEAGLGKLLPFSQSRIDESKLVDWHAVLLSSFSISP